MKSKTNLRLSSDQRSELLALAVKRAAAHDSRGMVEALYASGFLAGMKRQLQNKWPRLPAPDVDDCVAEAMNDAYEAVISGRPVHNLGGWLWKAADNMANKRWTEDHQGRRSADNLAAPPGTTAEELWEREEKSIQRREEVIQLAKSLLPQVGHGQVRDVMNLVIEAVENGIPDLPAELIAETLGIAPSAARSLLSRGLERLRRAAQAAGIELTLNSTAEDDENTLEEEYDQ